MNEEQFHKRVKEILAANRGPHNSPDSEFHKALSMQVFGGNGRDWNEQKAAQVIQQFEWATGTQPKTEKISEAGVKTILSEHLNSRGYNYTDIPEDDVKRPDGLIERNEKGYVCELKSPVLILDIETQLYKFKTTHRKILDFVHTASKQFESFDSSHDKPRVMVFTSIHPQLNWKSFTDAIQGGVVGQDGKLLPDFSNTLFYQSALPRLSGIDLYIWYQVSVGKGKFHQASYFLNEDSKHKDACMQLAANLSAPKISEMDNLLSVRFTKA
jgi:hypothetical protein